MSTILLSTSKALFKRFSPRSTTSSSRSLLPTSPSSATLPQPPRRRPISTTLPPAHNHTSLLPPVPARAPPPPPPPTSYYNNGRYYARYGLTPVMRTFQSYGNAQRKRPYTTQLLTSIAIYALGDLNAQLLFGKEGEEYDVLRTGRMVAIGSVFSIPSYIWFTRLGQSFNFRSKLLAVSTRVFVNQILFAPVFLCAFFTLQNTFQAGRLVSPKETVEKLKKTIPTAYGNSCRLWPAVTAVNFWIVPFEYRALFGGVVAVGWNGYLSYLNQKTAQEATTPAPATLSIPTKLPLPSIEPANVAVAAAAA